MIDGITRECLAIEVARSFTAQNVIDVLQSLFAFCGTRQHIRSDDRPEFTANRVRDWFQRVEVQTLFIEPGKRLHRELQRQASRGAIGPGVV